MTTRTLAEVLESVRRLLKAKRLPCPHNLGESCKCADGYADPAYAPLLALFQEDCKHPNSAWRDTAGFQAFCPDCGVQWEPTPGHLAVPAGVVSRFPYWQAAPDGALAGAIYRAIRVRHLELPYDAMDFAESWWDAMRSDANPDQAALEVLEKWLKGEA